MKMKTRKRLLGNERKLAELAIALGIICIVLAVSGCASTGEYKTTADLTGITTFYVRADGLDTNNGITENEPFKTITQAIIATESSAIKKITVIGVLDQNSQKSSSKASMILIRKKESSQITITGKTEASENERAVIRSIIPGQRVIEITGKSHVCFENIEISGGRPTGTNITKGGGGGIYMDKTTVTLGAGVVISNNYAGVGGGVANKEGTLTIDGAVISNNEALENGGGICIVKGTLNIKNGEISNNISHQSGAGVVIAWGNFEMTDGLISDNKIPDNSTQTGKGAGVYLSGSGAKFTMKKGIITRNYTDSLGAGVCVDPGCIFTMEDGLISENKAKLWGGGVGVFGTFTMSGGVITENYSAKDGGGIAVASGSRFNNNEGKIFNNKTNGKDKDIWRE
jgi:hypothetical protein